MSSISHLFVVSAIKRFKQEQHLKWDDVAEKINVFWGSDFYYGTQISTMMTRRKISDPRVQSAVSYLLLGNDDLFSTLAIPNNDALKKHLLDRLMELKSFSEGFNFRILQGKDYYKEITKIYTDNVRITVLNQLILQRALFNFVTDNHFNFHDIESFKLDEVVDYNIKKFNLSEINYGNTKIEGSDELDYFRLIFYEKSNKHSPFRTALKIKLFEVLDGQSSYL